MITVFVVIFVVMCCVGGIFLANKINGKGQGNKASFNTNHENPHTSEEVPDEENRKNIEAAADILADAIANDTGNGLSICALFNEDAQDDVWDRACTFADTFVNKGEKINGIYVPRDEYEYEAYQAIYPDRSEPLEADCTVYNNVGYILTTRKDIYAITANFNVMKNGRIEFVDIYVRINTVEFADIANKRSNDFDFDDEDLHQEDEYTGERRLIYGRSQHWNSASKKIKESEINEADWEKQKKIDEFIDTYGIPGASEEGLDNPRNIYYEIDNDDAGGEICYLYVTANDAGYIWRIRIINAAGYSERMYMIQSRAAND